MQELRNRLAGEPHVRQGYSFSPYHKDSVLHSQFSYVERWLRITREDTNEEKLEKLEAGLSEYTTRLGEAMALLASYLSISLDDRYAPLNTSLELQKEKTLDLFTDICIETAAVLPDLFIVFNLRTRCKGNRFSMASMVFAATGVPGPGPWRG